MPKRRKNNREDEALEAIGQQAIDQQAPKRSRQQRRTIIPRAPPVRKADGEKSTSSSSSSESRLTLLGKRSGTGDPRKSWCNKPTSAEWCESCRAFRDGDESAPRCKRTPGRRKIPMEYVEDEKKRRVMFSKRKKGLMKKAIELGTLTGAQVLLTIVAENGHRYDCSTLGMKQLRLSEKYGKMVKTCIAMYDAQDPEREEMEE